MRACVYMRVYMRIHMIAGNSHRNTGPPNTPPEHTTTGKERNTGKAEKPAYIGIIAGNEKKYKKVKKNLEI